MISSYFQFFVVKKIVFIRVNIVYPYLGRVFIKLYFIRVIFF